MLFYPFDKDAQHKYGHRYLVAGFSYISLLYVRVDFSFDLGGFFSIDPSV